MPFFYNAIYVIVISEDVMPKVTRVTVSIDEPLLEQFEQYLNANGYPSRSEGIKSIMRKALVEDQWATDAEVAAAVTIVYDHHKPGVMQRLTEVQHDFGDMVICTQHVHLDHHNCMEVLILKGKSAQIKSLFNSLKAIKGLKHSSLSASTTGGDIH